MCGLLKDILPDLQTLGVCAFEAYTREPLGNVRLIDGRNTCPTVCLIGGADATIWMRTADEIIAQLKRDLDELPHHRGLVLSSAGVMPPAAAPETIKEVFSWICQYKVNT